MSLRLLLTGEDYEIRGSSENLFATAFAIFVTLFLLETLTRLILKAIGGDILSSSENRNKIARNINECLAMFFMFWLGYTSFSSLKRFEPFQKGHGIEKVHISPVFYYIVIVVST